MAIVENQMVEVKWNNSVKKHYINKGYKYTNNGDIFVVHIKDLLPGGNSPVLATCDWCNETFTRPVGKLNRNNNKHHYCTNKCQLEHNVQMKNNRRLTKKCEFCNKEYCVANYQKETSRFCSAKCLNKWQSIAFKGENSSVYVQRMKVPCSWCKAILERTPSKMETRKNHFCDEQCRQSWHREIYSKSPEFIVNSRNTMLSNLSDGKIKFTETKPHQIINKILNELNVSYKNEKIYEYFSIDIYLEEYDLLIEINGGYWHCDPRDYQFINHKVQLDRIISDKRKQKVLLNKHNKNILYLWEKDILFNPNLCKRLILAFIQQKGKLENYHSFNYLFTEGLIMLNDKLIVPYTEMESEEILKNVDLDVKEKRMNYKPDKHIEFQCDHCGNFKKQYLNYYLKSKNHFCSAECKNKSLLKNSEISFHEVNCHHCSKSFKVKNYRYQNYVLGKTKRLYCSRDCQNKG